jgi:hypothetical protein
MIYALLLCTKALGFCAAIPGPAGPVAFESAPACARALAAMDKLEDDMWYTCRKMPAETLLTRIALPLS